jgi:hypothetical protein
MGPPPRCLLPMRITASWSGPWPTEYKDVARCFVHQPAAPLGSRHPDTLKCAVVLEALKDEPLSGVALRAILDRFCARRLSLDLWVGMKKRLSSRTKKLRDEKMDRTLAATPLTKNAP